MSSPPSDMPIAQTGPSPATQQAHLHRLACTAAIGGFLFGYDTGIISAVLVTIHGDLGHALDSTEKELMTALCSAGAFVGSVIAGLGTDKFGRKGAMYIGCLLFTGGAVVQGAAYSFGQMCAGRLVVGLGVGSAAAIIPLYLTEIAPTRFRGRIVGLNNASLTGGQVVSYAVGAALTGTPHGWRYMVGLGGVPSLLLAGLLPFCPESPRFLVMHGKRDEARRVIGRIFKQATPGMIEDKVTLIEANVMDSLAHGTSRWQAIKAMHTDPAKFRALLCACTLMVISQMSGFNTLMYYSSTLFALVGFSNPTAVGLVVAGTNFLMTFINAMIVDPYGRRRVLVGTVWGMAAGLLAVAVAFVWIPVDLGTLEVTADTASPAAVAVLVSIIWYCVFYGLSVGNIAWMSTDFFPADCRAVGTMWMTCCNWGPNLIVSSTFLTMMKSLTPSGAFGFYAGICFTGWVLIILFYPEVSGLSLEDVHEVFKHGFGVKYANQLRKAKREEGTLVTAGTAPKSEAV
ncbi:MFS sugar transporter [Xylariomycetidae sp. FL2044]|nr:MFS sugar transporter [Xylariomycetidae sp. FL2044]